MQVEARVVEEPVFVPEVEKADRRAGRAVRRSVLVADDDPEMLRLLSALLRHAGHRVVEARTGIDILDRMESTIWKDRVDLFDVIVSDVSMPGLSGLDILAALRCTRWTTPVILITAFADADMREEALSLGAAAVLDKPVDRTELERLVSTVAADPVIG